jgi:hypothetical protein
MMRLNQESKWYGRTSLKIISAHGIAMQSLFFVAGLVPNPEIPNSEPGVPTFLCISSRINKI